MNSPAPRYDCRKKLIHTFRAVLAEHTGILISHRFSTVQMADFIYVLDGGKIIESGTHAALLAKNGQYVRVYHTARPIITSGTVRSKLKLGAFRAKTLVIL
jgi:ATP-binding cassette subfamily B protein